MNSHRITVSTARTDVHVTLDNGVILKGTVGTPIEDFLQFAIQTQQLTLHAPLIACVCNNKLRELTFKVEKDVSVSPITLASTDGGRIYRRSLIFILVTAINELFTDIKVNVNYAVPDGGFFVQLVNHAPFTPEEVATLEAHMHHIVSTNDPITKTTISLEEAEKLFAQRGDDDKVRLLQYRTRDSLVMYHLRNHNDYYFGYMVASTGYLTTFKLIWVEGGFILQYPRQENPYELGELEAYSKLSKVFQQANDWLRLVEVEDIGRLNSLVTNNRVQEMILVSEALHEQQISDIAKQIVQSFEKGVRVVAIAGPSSSGKTTFSKRLSIQLLAQGMSPFALGMDNFFVERPLTPRDTNGDYDFEALEAVNLPLFNDTIIRLLKGDRVQLPRFDFFEGTSTLGTFAQLGKQQLIIIEGIHGLNPNLFTIVPNESVFRVYVSSVTQLNIDRHNRIATTDVRLLRRIVRDAHTRGYTATETIKRWASVRLGEKRNIFPHQENADALFNSALVYELAALRPLVEPLLLQIDANNTVAQIEANRLLAFLSWVQPLTTAQIGFIPDTSLLREFIGGSVLDDYHPGMAYV